MLAGGGDPAALAALAPPAPQARMEREAGFIREATVSWDVIVTTGLVLKQLLQGFRGPSQARRILKDFSLLPVVEPEMDDHIAAAALRNHCRRHGVQISTIDALLAQLCIRNGLHLLTADRDFESMARYCSLTLLRR